MSTRLVRHLLPVLLGQLLTLALFSATPIHADQQIAVTPAVAAASVVVNFAELARAEATRAASESPRGIAMPLPMSLPEPAGATALPGSAIVEPSLLPQASPAPSLNYAGLDDIPTISSGAWIIPPDTDGAVGLSHVMSGLNNNYRIQTKSTGATVSTVSTDSFWSATGGTNFFDPKTIYDPYNNRWIVCMMSNPATADSSVVFGVSQTSNPTGAYNLFRVDTDAGNTTWADFPSIGFNKNWVAIGVNMFNISNNLYSSSKMLIIDYPQLRGGTFSGTWVTTGFCTSPALTYSSTESTLYCVTHVNSAAGTYHLDTITGTPAAPVFTAGSTRARGITWTQPGGNILPQKPPDAGAVPAEPRINCGDAYVRQSPVWRNGSTYYAQTIGLPAGGPITRTAVLWTKLNASGVGDNGAVQDGGVIDEPPVVGVENKWYAYPHIAVNKLGDILVGFSQFAANQHPSAGYCYHDHTDPAGEMRQPYIYKAGEDFYYKTFGSGRNRWGDYSKAQVDPVNDLDLWTLQEYAKTRTGTDIGNGSNNSSRWGTWWARVSISAAKPDLWNRIQGEPAYIGDNVYSTDGVNQTKSVTVANNATATYLFRIQNDGNAADTFKHTGPAAAAGWTVRYYAAGVGEITAAVTGAGWTSPSLAPGASAGLWATVTPGGGVVGGAKQIVKLTAVSGSNAAKKDVIRAITTVQPLYRPDLTVRRQADAAYLGNNIYNLTGAGQGVTLSQVSGSTGTAVFRVQNDGNTADSYKITGPATGAGWTVRYFASGVGEITAAVTGAGYTTPLVAIGGLVSMWVTVTPNAAADTAPRTLLITAASVGLATAKDVIKVIANCYRPDMQIRTSAESSYTGNNVYNLTGAGQTKAQNAAGGSAVTYLFLAQNDSAIADTLKITGTAGPAGWTVRYFAGGVGEITAQVTGAGRNTALLAPGASASLWVTVSPNSGVTAGAAFTATVTAVSLGDGTKKDVVKATTTKM